MTETPAPDLPFWKTKKLEDMSREEWESLCDGCGNCCRHKLGDVETGEIVETNVTCRLLDTETARCSDYNNRRRKVPNCFSFNAELLAHLTWLPETCGYRRVQAGQDLDWWHPLVSGDPNTVHTAGISVVGKVIREQDAGNLRDHVHKVVQKGRPNATVKAIRTKTAKPGEPGTGTG